METCYCYYSSPVGRLLLAGDGVALSLLSFPTGNKARRHQDHWQENRAAFRAVTEQLDQYFAGEREQFDLPLARQGTDFQQTVWQALTEIPYGDTWSYGQLARHIGNPKACQAVGAANAANPISIIIPCHRVIGSNGQLTGFGGGLETKARLLDLESANAS